jgi:preprotein translocase subunit YajC
VITTSGVYGVITGEDGENRFWLEIDDDVQIRIARAAISGKSSLDDGDDAGTDTDETVSSSADDD